MLEKCTVLANDHEDSAVLRTFRDALAVAQDLQNAAIQTLAEALLTGAPDRESLRPILLRGFAWQMTQAPHASPGANANVEQRNRMRHQLQSLLDEATKPQHQAQRGWEAAVLNALIRPLATQSTTNTTAPLATTSAPPRAPRKANTVHVSPPRASSLADFQKRVQLRDALMQALRIGTPQAIQKAVARLPAGVDLATYLPDPVPDHFQEQAWAHASAYTLQRSQPVQMYATRCHRLATWQRWVSHNVQRHPDAQQLFAPKLREFCDVLRTTPETQFGAKAPQILQKLQAVLVDPRHIQALAQQPLTSLSTLANQCELLGAHVRSPALRTLRVALAHAQTLQDTATRALRKELLSDTIDDKKLKPLVLMAFAREATSVPMETLSGTTSKAQKEQMLRRLEALHARSQLTDLDDGGFYGAVLKRLGDGVKESLRAETPTLDVERLEFAEEIATETPKFTTLEDFDGSVELAMELNSPSKAM